MRRTRRRRGSAATPVGPLAVVHRHQHRRPVGDVHHQPVQAVQRLEADLGGARGLLVWFEQPGRRGWRRWRTDPGARTPGGSPAPAAGAPPERERLLQLRTGRFERHDARALGLGAGLAQQRGVLPTPGGPSISSSVPSPAPAGPSPARSPASSCSRSSNPPADPPRSRDQRHIGKTIPGWKPGIRSSGQPPV